MWDHARAAARAVDDAAELAAEQVGFANRDGRDITGFVDGTEPAGPAGARRGAGAGGDVRRRREPRDEIFRRSVPFGTVDEYGLRFVAFSADLARFDVMLSRMYGLTGGGARDRLLDFSRPVSGAYAFAPSLNALRELAGPETDWGRVGCRGGLWLRQSAR